MTTSNTASMHQMPGFTDLFAVLFECFFIIALGYFSARFKIISAEAKDIGSYLSTFALPMIIFLNIAQMEFQTINITFLFCMLAAKLILFISVAILTLAIGYPRNYGYAGALSILATQSNDFALGYPLVKSLYGKSKPEMLSYLSLMAPIQLLILNPLGIVMLEFEKSRERARRLKKQDKDEEDFYGRFSKRCNNRHHRVQCSSCRGAPTTRNPQEVYNSERHGADNLVQTEEEVASRQQQASISEKPTTYEQEQTNRLINGSSYVQTNGQIIGCLHPSVIDKKDLGSLLRSSCFQSESLTDFGIIHRRRPSSELRPKATTRRPVRQDGAHNNGPSTSCSEISIDSLDCQMATIAESQPRRRSVSSSASASATQASQSATRPKLLSSLFHSFGNSNNREPTSGQNDAPPCFCPCVCIQCSGEHPQAAVGRETRRSKEPIVDLSFLKALATNPLIIASIAALAVNLIHGPELPKFITKVSNTIAASFAAPALLVVGLSMYGRFQMLSKNPSDLMLSTILVISKVVILPSLMRTIALLVLPHHTTNEEMPYLTDFSYLYGLLPTAPGACIIAKQYNVLGNVVSISMLLSTFLSAPLMLAASFIINQTNNMDPTTYDFSGVMSMIMQTIRVSSLLTLVLSFLTICALMRIDKKLLDYIRRVRGNQSADLVPNSNNNDCNQQPPSVAMRVRNTTASLFKAAKQGDVMMVMHLLTFLLVITQFIIGIGGGLWLLIDPCQDSNFEDESRPMVHIFSHGETEDENNLVCAMQYMFSSGGILMARFVMMSMVVTNFAFQLRGYHVANRVLQLMFRVFVLFGIALVVCLTFEAGHSRCFPTDASLPTWTLSLQLRLIYNVTILLLAVPLLSATFRSSNKAEYMLKELVAKDLTRGRSRHRVASHFGQKRYRASQLDDDYPILAERQSVASSHSLSSTSTIDTQLDVKTSIMSNNMEKLKREASPADSTQRNAALHSDALNRGLPGQLTGHSGAPSGENLQQNQPIGKSTLKPEHEPNNNSDLVIFIGRDPIEEQHATESIYDSPTKGSDTSCKSHHATDNAIMQSQNEFFSTSGDHSYTQHQHWPHQSPRESKQRNAFNRYSILMVFMLIQVMLNITSIIQVLIQDKPFGTLIQVEITTVALDFGQGILTFLVIGIQKFPSYMISASASVQPSNVPNV